MLLPRVVSSFLLERYSNKLSMVFSNVPGPKNPYLVAGKKVHSQYFFVPQMKSVSGGISIISHADCITIGLFMDKAIIDDPNTLMQLFYKNFDTILGADKWRDFYGGQIE